MIEIQFELEGVEEAEAQAALLKTIRFYQHALVGVTCPTHGSSPALKIRGNTGERLSVSIETCCAALTSAADDRVRAVSRRDDDGQCGAGAGCSWH
jgi:hypothetical protein